VVSCGIFAATDEVCAGFCGEEGLGEAAGAGAAHPSTRGAEGRGSGDILSVMAVFVVTLLSAEGRAAVKRRGRGRF